MKLIDFINLATKQDQRNLFSRYEGTIKGIPAELEPFYKNYNPIDVEVKINGNYVKFFPYDRINEMQNEYALNKNCFIFASCNGEPIYLKDGAVFTCVVGKTEIIEELLADTLDRYWELIDQ